MSILRTITGPVRSVADVLFPQTCWADGEAPEALAGLSEGARLRIGRLAAQGYCFRCGLTTGPFARNDAEFRCGRCAGRLAGISRAARVGTFSEPLVGLVHRMKFGRAWEVAGVVAPFLHHAMVRVAEETGGRVDCLVPVPLHWWRRARRGFNQAEELARETARMGGWEVRRVLKRVRGTSAQARISAPTARAENVKEAFVCVNAQAVADKHVWLVDDVITTGATLHAAGAALRELPKELRPASVNVAVLCVTDHESPPPQE
ncbi:MAG: ComF family protein [Phycisphaerae bacterium]